MAIKSQKISEVVWDSDLRIIRPEDASALARLMDVSYRGTIDHEGETPQQCEEEILATINGKYGPFVSRSLS